MERGKCACAFNDLGRVFTHAVDGITQQAVANCLLKRSTQHAAAVKKRKCHMKDV